MGLAELYNEQYGNEETKTASVNKEAAAEQEIQKIAEMVDESGFSDEECAKLAEACDLMDAEGLEFESAEEKLAAAAEVVDKIASGEIVLENEDEKTAAEFDAAGRIMARGFIDEINKKDEPQSLSEKLAASKK